MALAFATQRLPAPSNARPNGPEFMGSVRITPGVTLPPVANCAAVNSLTVLP